ncbi:MAG: hypothetical protein RJA25_677 [Bacteroidota bacterium]
MSSAILAVLYPKDFTVYDVRVCETFLKFKGIDNTSNFENLWTKYQDYIESIRNYEPTKGFLLRDKDRYLWAKSFYDQLKGDIENNFEKSDNVV